MKFKHGYLADYFDGFGYKRLKPVEIDPDVSNEHEFNGISQFKKLFGTEKIKFQTKAMYLSDDEENITEDDIELTWYDARERHPSRTEYRLYYQSSICIDKASEGDLLIICKNKDNTITMFIAKKGSTIENQLAWLLGISLVSTDNSSFKVQTLSGNKQLDYFSKLILEKIGIETAEQLGTDIDILFEKFPDGLPATTEFSAFTRSLLPEISPMANADTALVEWLDYEETLFKAFENQLVEKKLKNGFENVEDFLRFSLSVQNRRKSRAGFALENHLKFIFEIYGIRHSHNQITENRSKPDFIFPGIVEYRDEKFPCTRLTMLGAKTSCKDRWRQILSEAGRISDKHLFTIEPGITQNQTDEMIDHKVQLVVPDSIISTYNDKQKAWLFNLDDFIGLVRERQKK